MRKRKLSLVRAAAVGAAALSATLIVGGGVASASVPSDPPGGATPVPPHFYNGNVEGIRDTGSDTTFFMMQKIGDLYTGAGLYGCTLNSSAGQTLYNSSDPASSTTNEEFFCQSGQNISTTDVNDNWDRTEVTEGVDDVGSGAGQNQLCDALSTPLPVDFARSSKPAGTACSHHGRDRLRQGRRADHRLPGEPDRLWDLDHLALLGRSTAVSSARSLRAGCPVTPTTGPTPARRSPTSPTPTTAAGRRARPTGSGAPRMRPGSPTGARSPTWARTS